MEWIERKPTKEDMKEPYIYRVLAHLRSNKENLIEIISIYEDITSPEGIEITLYGNPLDEIGFKLIKWMHLPQF